MGRLLSHNFLCNLIREGVEQRTGHGTLAEILAECVDDAGGGSVLGESIHLFATSVDGNLLIHQEVGIITLVILLDESILLEVFDLSVAEFLVAISVVKISFDGLLGIEEDTDEVATSEILVDSEESIGSVCITSIMIE